MAAKLNVKNEAGVTKTVTAKNGQKYVHTKEGKVKKVGSLADIKKLDITLKTDYKKMTIDLHRYIRDKEVGNKLVTVTYKSGTVLFKKYKMSYSDKGLTLIDVGSFSRVVKHGLGAYPTAEEVYKYLNVNRVDKVQIERKQKERRDKVNELIKRVVRELKPGNLDKMTTKNAKLLYDQLKAETGISESLKKSYTEKLLTKYPYLLPREEDVVNNFRKKALQYVKRQKKTDLLIKKLDKFIPNRSFNVFFGKLVMQLRNKEIRNATFKEELLNLIQDDTIFAPRLKPAPKFIIRPIYHIDEILEQTEEYVTFRNKTGDHTVAKSDVLLRDLLYMDSRYHVAIHKYLRGTITLQELIKSPIQRDKFVCLDYNDIKEHNAELYEWAEDVLLDNDSLNPLDILYRNDITFEIGDKIVTRFAGMCDKRKATVSKYENGWKVRYEDGTVDYLYKGQIFKTIK